MRKTFFYVNHQDKGKAYVEALVSRGWKQVSSFEKASIALIDSDVTPYRRDQIKHAERVGCKVFVYPHAARPPLYNDFWEPNPMTTAQFVTTKTHKDIMGIIGYPNPVHPVGWSLCPIEPFRPSHSIQSVLFAPIHANGQGWLNWKDKEINQRTFLALRKTGKRITVRYIGKLEDCGLEYIAGVTYVKGHPDQTYNNIEDADVVVSHETFAYLAIARGKPTLMMDETIPPRFGDSDEKFGHAKKWNLYMHLVRYPYWVRSEDALDDMYIVSERNSLVEEWKERMIGYPFNPDLFMWHIESYGTSVLSGV